MNKNNEITVIVLGADGMAGMVVCDHFKSQGYNIIGTTRRQLSSNNFNKDIPKVLIDFSENLENFESMISKYEPDLVINCVGSLNQAAEENKHDAVFINAYLPHYISNLSEKYEFSFIHISTDCVFSGDSGKYDEDSFQDAKSFYGRSKALGELNNNRALTLRTSIVGPDKNLNGIGLFNWFMNQKETQIDGYENVIWSGVTTLELARCIESAYHQKITGLVNLVNNTVISKYDLLILFKTHSEKKISIKRNSDIASDKSLKSKSAEIFSLPSYDSMVKEMCAWSKDNKIYPIENII